MTPFPGSVPRFLAPLLFLALLGLGPAVRAEVLTFEGLVQPNREVTVSSPVESVLVELTVREGDRVEAGELLARLYARQQELEVHRAAAALEKREFENAGAASLFAENLISEDEALEKRIELDIARVQLEIAEEAVDRRRITAPLTGIVVEKFPEEGELARAGDPLFEVVDIRTVRVQFYLNSGEARRLSLGERHQVRVPALGPDRIFEAEVDFIDPRIDPASGLMRVRMRVDNPQEVLKPGLRAVLVLETGPTGT
jgi:membrane fusion protein (multidrug efflux system)